MMGTALADMCSEWRRLQRSQWPRRPPSGQPAKPLAQSCVLDKIPLTSMATAIAAPYAWVAFIHVVLAESGVASSTAMRPARVSKSCPLYIRGSKRTTSNNHTAINMTKTLTKTLTINLHTPYHQIS